MIRSLRLSPTYTFTISGTRHSVTREDVERRLSNATPESIKANMKYWVEVNGRRFPVKQAVSDGLGIPRAAFQTQEAFRVLRNLGFVVGQVERMKE